MHYSCTNSSTLVIKTVLYLLSHHIKFITCNLYNNILVKSTNQFLQCTNTKTTSNKGHYVGCSICASTLIPMTQQGHYKYRLHNDNVHAQVQHL